MSLDTSQDLHEIIHRQIDAMLNLQGVDGYNIAIAVFHAGGVKCMQYGQGNVSAEDHICAKLNMLIDHCRTLNTPVSLAMIEPINTCITQLENICGANMKQEMKVVGHA